MQSGRQMGPYLLLSSRDIYENAWMAVREDRVMRPDGQEGQFAVINMRAGVTVLALSERNETYLVKEYKFAIEADSIELVSGGMEEGEAALETAKRELREEAGLEGREWIDMGVVDPFTTIVHSPNYLFLAIGLREVESANESGDVCEMLRVPFAAAVEMVMSGEISHAASCVLILKAQTYLSERDFLGLA